MRCINCDRETSNPKFCSQSCSASYNNRINPKRRRKSLCAKPRCNAITKSSQHPLCDAHWREYQQTKKATRDTSQTIKDIMYTRHHKSSAFALIRGRARAQLKHGPCQKCGYGKHTEVCHIKAIADFPITTKIAVVNHPSNLMRLCRNCHWEFDHPEKRKKA